MKVYLWSFSLALLIGTTRSLVIDASTNKRYSKPVVKGLNTDGVLRDVSSGSLYTADRNVTAAWPYRRLSKHLIESNPERITQER